MHMLISKQMTHLSGEFSTEIGTSLKLNMQFLQQQQGEKGTKVFILLFLSFSHSLSLLLSCSFFSPLQSVTSLYYLTDQRWIIIQVNSCHIPLQDLSSVQYLFNFHSCFLFPFTEEWSLFLGSLLFCIFINVLNFSISQKQQSYDVLLLWP